MTVSQDGTAEYISIQQAIDSIPKNNTAKIKIFIKNGVYKEKLFVENSNINLIGENAEKTIIIFDDYSKKKFSDGREMGTFNSYTFFIGGNDFKAENITFENSSGSGKIYGQAIACYVDSDKSYFKNCRFLGNQDTLFTGPLPPSPIIQGSFSGPRENAPRVSTTQYYENCFISGDIDFIFGSAKAIFNKCEIFSKDRHEKINGYITAASTPNDQEFGFVFFDCKLTGNAEPETVYLGRPWREFAKTVFINCWMGEHIISCGWDNWGKVNVEKTVMFGEYNSTGPGAKMNKRVKWAKVLNDEEAEKYTLENIFVKK